MFNILYTHLTVYVMCIGTYYGDVLWTSLTFFWGGGVDVLLETIITIPPFQLRAYHFKYTVPVVSLNKKLIHSP